MEKKKTLGGVHRPWGNRDIIDGYSWNIQPTTQGPVQKWEVSRIAILIRKPIIEYEIL